MLSVLSRISKFYKMRWLVLVFMLYMVSYAPANSTTSVSKDAYTFYYPFIVIAKRAVQVCLTIKKHLLPATVKITYLNTTCDETCDSHTVNSDFECWKINIPDQSKKDLSYFTIMLEIETKDKDIKFKEENQLAIHSNVETILETDRSVYKMGDIVKIRIVAFDFDSKPVKGYKISSLAINSPYPSDATIKEWHNISANLGLIHIEFQLASDAPEGEWSISGDKVYGSFEVKKYIWPRFQVIITGPESIHNGSKSVSYLVCGKYSYGRNIKGVSLLEVKLVDYDQPLYQVKDGLFGFYHTIAVGIPAILSMPSLEATDLGDTAWFVESNSAGNGIALDGRGSTVRSFFPETWLWELVPVQNGEIKLDRKLPDSITDWQGSVVCMSATEGFGVSDQIEIKGFKPFSVDILLQYSIKRNKEILQLPIPVFNYLNHSLPIRVTLESSDDIILVDGQDRHSFSMCLASEDSYTHHYRIKATKLGSVNIIVSANVDPANAENCASELVIRRRDVVQKPLLVEPEGYSSSFVKRTLLCANDTLEVDNVEWNINLPENVVADTVDGKITINFDILGPKFQQIVVVPTGGDEETQPTLTPDLYVMQYLKANNALTDKTKDKIVKNLEIVYQSMLTHVHEDGSLSFSGKNDKNGSMFLTAFLIGTFSQMEKFIFIDSDVINKAMKWVITHQLKNGCFEPGNQIHHELGLPSSANQTSALASYVLINTLLTNTKLDDNILSKAKECILNDTTVDKYTLAISSYALGLINITQEAKERLNKLLEVGNIENGLLWWKQSDKSLSENIVITSYVLMSLLQQDPVANLGTATSIVRWLVSQINPNGDFVSVMDTVIGLDSIFRYATLVNKNEPNVKISLETRTDKRDVEITKRDPIKPEIIPLTTYPNEVKANIEGNGCVSIQTTVNYYLDKPATLDDFELEIQLKPVNPKFKCSLIELKPCVSYASLGEINMAIVEVNMPSGYAPDQASLYALKTTDDSNVKKFELIKNQVVFYLTKLGANKVCLPLTIEEYLIIEDVANATVKLYDYYNPEISVSKSFKLEVYEANIAIPV